MKGFILSLKSEFYKSRKTLGFWAAILLPLIILLLTAVGYYFNSDSLMIKASGMMSWMRLASVAIGVMGNLLLPMFVIFIAYSANSMEHKADTLKSLFTSSNG